MSSSKPELDAQEPETFEHMITIITSLAGNAELAEVGGDLDERDRWEDEVWKYANSWWKERQELLAQREQAAELRGRIDELKTISDPVNGRAVFKVPMTRIRDRLATLQATKPEKEG